MINYLDKGIIVLDGADGVGKSTQMEMLKNSFSNSQFEFIKFPVYDSDMGFYITNYLKGNLNHIFEGLDYMDRIKKISTLYTMDRVSWFNQYYNKYKPLICDRYTTSNIIHMSGLLALNGATLEEIHSYIDWLHNLEYWKLNIPRPTMVIYLDAPYKELMKHLNTTDKVLDIHENNELLEKIDSIKSDIFEYCGFKVINCMDGSNFRPKEEIHKEIVGIITDFYINSYLFGNEENVIR